MWSTYNTKQGVKAKSDHNSAYRKDPFEAARLIQDLCKDHFTRALRLYREMVKHDLDSQVTTESFYVALVEGAVRVGKPDVALQVLERMRENKLEPSTALLQSIFKLLCARRYFQECIAVADLCEPQVDPVISSCLTLAAGELGRLDLCSAYLQRAATDLPVESTEYLPLMRAYARRKDWGAAVAAVRELMSKKLVIDNVIFNSVLASCDGSGDNAEMMRALLDEMRAYDKTAVDIVSYNTMMKVYARRRMVMKCFSILEEIRENGLEPDDVTFSTLLDACIDENEHELAAVALQQLVSSGVEMNCVLLTTLMKGFIRSKRMDLAMNLYDEMRKRGSEAQPDMVTYSQLIKAQCDNQNMHRALDIFEDMLQCGCRVDDVVFTHLLEGCTHISNVDLAEKLFGDMKSAKIRPTIYTLTALVKVYGKCGKSEKAARLVESMEDEYGVRPNVVICTCLISGLIRQKKYRTAYESFQRMEYRAVPDAHFVTTIMTGLSDGQMWAEIIDVARRAKHWPKADCANRVLTSMLNRAEISFAREFYKMMLERKIEVTVPSISRRLNLAL